MYLIFVVVSMGGAHTIVQVVEMQLVKLGGKWEDL